MIGCRLGRQIIKGLSVQVRAVSWYAVEHFNGKDLTRRWKQLIVFLFSFLPILSVPHPCLSVIFKTDCGYALSSSENCQVKLVAKIK
jgi:hypothetical protein